MGAMFSAQSAIPQTQRKMDNGITKGKSVREIYKGTIYGKYIREISDPKVWEP